MAMNLNPDRSNSLDFHPIVFFGVCVDNKDPFEFMVGTIIVAPVMAVLGGLTSYILPKGRTSKVYLIQENEWEIVNY